MKANELAKRVEHICSYIIGGIEAARLRMKYKEVCEARAEAVALERELRGMLERYE